MWFACCWGSIGNDNTVERGAQETEITSPLAKICGQSRRVSSRQQHDLILHSTPTLVLIHGLRKVALQHHCPLDCPASTHSSPYITCCKCLAWTPNHSAVVLMSRVSCGSKVLRKRLQKTCVWVELLKSNLELLCSTSVRDFERWSRALPHFRLFILRNTFLAHPNQGLPISFLLWRYATLLELVKWVNYISFDDERIVRLRRANALR